MRKMFPEIEAKVVLCRCPVNKKLFGIRVERQGRIWLMTWSFKIDETRARREGYDRELITGLIAPAQNYPGCPYCGVNRLAVCICGRVFCWRSETNRAACPWCGLESEYGRQEGEITIEGGNL
jgi:hypothetical protein